MIARTDYPKLFIAGFTLLACFFGLYEHFKNKFFKNKK